MIQNEIEIDSAVESIFEKVNELVDAVNQLENMIMFKR